MTSVEDLVDGGEQDPMGWRPPIHAEHCIRDRHRKATPVHPGFSFCRDCLAWLTGESDDDPLDDGPELAKLQTSPEMWGRGGLEPPYTNHVRERGAL